MIRCWKQGKKVWKYALGTVTPLLGLLAYMGYLLITTKDPLAFFHSQSVFGPARSTKIIFLPQVLYRYLKILFTASTNFQYYVSLLELVTFLFVFLILIMDLINNLSQKNKNYSLISLNIFSMINIILPTFTGSFLSIPRFALLTPSFFIFLGRIKKTWIIFCLLIIFIVLRTLLLSLFIQGYFIS